MQFVNSVARLFTVSLVIALLGFAGLRIAFGHQSETEMVASDDLPGPDLTLERDRRLTEKGLTAGSPMFIRIFKAEFELELWLRKGDRFELFATYPICYWSGTLGPKLHEGDKQAPEGFYAVGPNQIHRRGRWPRSLNIGYPNALDRAHARTGSLILVHGGCTSTGCFAMTNPVMAEIYTLAEQALQHGQDRIPIHVFPFRMTEANLATRTPAHGEWRDFWLTLKAGYDLFESTRVPPKVGICNKQYAVRCRGPDRWFRSAYRARRSLCRKRRRGPPADRNRADGDGSGANNLGRQIAQGSLQAPPPVCRPATAQGLCGRTPGPHSRTDRDLIDFRGRAGSLKPRSLVVCHLAPDADFGLLNAKGGGGAPDSATAVSVKAVW